MKVENLHFVAVFGEYFLFQFFFPKKGIYDLIFFFQNIFHQMEKFTTKKHHCIQVEELRKIKLETTYPPFNGLLFLLSLAKDVVFQTLCRIQCPDFLLERCLNSISKSFNKSNRVVE